MVGYSIIQALKEAPSDRKVEFVVIDPFTGDVNMCDWDENAVHTNGYRFIRLENAQPTIFERFVANTASVPGLLPKLVPLRTTNIVGLKLLKRLYEQDRRPYLPHIIYLDRRMRYTQS